MRSLLLLLAFLLLAAPARAQTIDARWAPWLGCWEMVVDTPRDNAPQVCVTRTPNGGAQFEVTVSGKSVVEQTVVADGAPHPLLDDECRGEQRAEWSKSGLRLFSSAALACKGDPEPRRVSGLSMIAPNGNWLDIQTVSVGSRETLRVRRYFRPADSTYVERPSVAASALTLEEIKEASSKVTSGTLEAAITESNVGYKLNARALIDLDDAGVSKPVIDLLVALSYPDKFLVERVGRGPTSAPSPAGADPYRAGPALGHPYYYDPFFYSSYYYSPYYYAPFGYYGGWYDPYPCCYGGGGGVVVVSPGSTGTGRVVNGLGYTQVRPRETPPGQIPTPRTTRTATSSSGSARSAPSGTSSSESGSSSGSSGSSGSGTASSSGGYSPSGSGGSSSGGGRTAVPR